MGVDVWRLAATAVFILLNGFFVAAEFALVKSRPVRVANLAKEGSSAAVLASRMMGRLDLYLSACQLGITIASLVLGWLAEPAVAALIIAGAEALGLGLNPDIVHGVALVTALVFITILHMTVGEQAPKIWAIRRSERMLLTISRPLYYYAFLFRPLIILVNAASNLLLRAVGLKEAGHGDPPPEPEEIRGLLAQSAAAGHISNRQRGFADNVIKMVSLEARHILVPRSEIVHLSTALSAEENLERMAASGHSRFPLCNGDLDEVVGVVHVKTVFMAAREGGRPDPTAAAREPVFVPDTLPVSKMIRQLQQARSGCAVVVDDHGTNIGMVFLDDALEEIVGPIHDEFDGEASPMFTALPGDAYELSARMPLPEAAELLGLEPEDDDDTIGGYVTAHLGRIPKAGDKLTVDRYEVTVDSVRRRTPHRLTFRPAGEETGERG